MSNKEISTADCKAFLTSISAMLGIEGGTWKRTRKYTGIWQEEYVPFRDFVNSQEDSVFTVAQTPNGLILYAIERCYSQDADEVYGEWQFDEDRCICAQDVCEFMAWCVAQDPQILDCAQDQEHGQYALNWSAHSYQDMLGFEDCEEGYDVVGCGADSDVFYETSCLDFNSEVVKVYEVHMPDFDTVYRFSVFQTKDNRLVLGTNNPD